MLHNVIISFIVSFIVTLCVSYRSMHAKTKAAKIIDRAAREGCMTTARLISRGYLPWHNHVIGRHSPSFSVKYEYVVNGKTYRIKRWITYPRVAPETLRVFYVKGKPGKCYVSDFDRLGIRYTVILFMPWIVFLCTFAILQLKDILPAIIHSMM